MTILTCILLTVLWTELPRSGKCDLIIGKNQSTICLDCLEAQQATRCNIPFCELDHKCENIIDIKNFTESETNDLKPVCRDDSSITFKWNPSNNTYFFIEYSRESSTELSFTNLTLCNFQTVYGLNSNKKYEIRLYSLALEYKRLFRSETILGFTTKASSPRTSVKKLNYTLTLDNELENDYNYTLMLENELENVLHSATVTWQPGADLSCLYEILWYKKIDEKEDSEPGNHLNHQKVNLRKRLIPEYIISNLNLGTEYEFYIKSIDRSGRKESAEKSIHIVVPTCLDLYKDVSMCPPDEPKSLTLNLICTDTILNIKFNWTKPRFEPNYYNATLVSQIDTSILRATSLNISGASNSAVFEKVELGIENRIQLTAHSDGGISYPVYSTFPFKFCEESSANYIKWLWIWSCLLSIIVLLALMFIFRLKISEFLVQHFDFKQKIDNAIVKYVINDREDLKWELNEAKLTLKEVIGVGAFGVVQKGWYRIESNKQSEVGVKMLKARSTDEQISHFYDEIEIMKSVPRHPHIVYLIGVISKSRPDNPLMLVEYCAKGDLQTFLRSVWLVLGDRYTSNHKYSNSAVYSDDSTKFSNKFYDMEESFLLKKDYVLESKDLLSFARQIVIGMEFLSSLKMIHRDLAARNILLNDQYTIKISDFGLCRDIYTNNVYQKVTGGKLPFRWMALESLTHQVYTTESDVWSFGIVLWEIVTLGGNPFPTIKTEDLIQLLKENYRMENPINCSGEVYNIMLRCWEARPSQRPTFTELREAFDTLLESEMQYISLEDTTKLDLNYYENTRNRNIEVLCNPIK